MLGATPSLVLGHFGASAQLIVTADFILPGQEFEVVAIDLTRGAIIAFDIRREELELTVPLESTTAPQDGHFRVNMSIPADFPNGYAQLYAVAQDGTQAMTWVFVGEPTASTPPPPGTGPWYADPSVIVLLVLALGAVGTVASALIRRRNAPMSAARIRRRRL